MEWLQHSHLLQRKFQQQPTSEWFHLLQRNLRWSNEQNVSLNPYIYIFSINCVLWRSREIELKGFVACEEPSGCCRIKNWGCRCSFQRLASVNKIKGLWARSEVTVKKLRFITDGVCGVDSDGGLGLTSCTLTSPVWSLMIVIKLFSRCRNCCCQGSNQENAQSYLFHIFEKDLLAIFIITFGAHLVQ